MAAALFVLRTPCLSRTADVFLKSNILLYKTPMVNQSKNLRSNPRSAFRRANIAAIKPTSKERLFAPEQRTGIAPEQGTGIAPEQGTAFNLGKSFLVGASALGIGSLCYYGIGLSSEPGAIDKSMVWPKYVKDRIKSTYAYFGGSILITAASAFAVSRSLKLFSLMMRHPLMAFGATFAALIGSVIIVLSIPYSEGIGTKQLAWVVHCGLNGAVVAPLCLLCGPLIMIAAFYTAGIVGGLSAVAACAPSAKFFYMGGPLASGLSVVLASSLGSMFFPPTTALGAGLYSINMYGGLVLFGAYLLCDTQKIIRKAETYPTYAIHPYDPINASMSIYLDTLNIFIRIVMILARAVSSRRK